MINEISLSEWDRWFAKYVEPIFLSNQREEYYEKIKQIQTPFYPKYWVAEKFYNRLRDDNRFDEQLKKYFSFLYSCGFFMEFIITFEEWLNMSNWENPNSNEIKSETILEIIKKDNGVNILKNRLRWLPFLS
jgi:hypothetical protein